MAIAILDEFCSTPVPHQWPPLFACLLSIALERDCLSGYGILIYLITKDGIKEYDLASRND